ncbi:MAG: hypothetical protein ACK4R6_09745 [Spirosomataceae bacterium]
MGYSKYHEDNEKITFERKFDPKEVEVLVSSPLQKKSYKCYYCNLLFESLDTRNHHVKSSHNVVGPLLLINGKIVPNDYYTDKVHSIKIAMCGFKDIRIHINNLEIQNSDAEIDLTGHLNEASVDCLTIKIGSRSFNIFKYVKGNITNSLVNEIIVDWEKQVNENRPLSPSGSNYPEFLNEVEKTYLDGFFNYYTACKKDIKSLDKKNRYAEAFALLSSFDSLTPKARVLLKVIAFRLNWIEKLSDLSNVSSGTFDSVVDFFYDRHSLNYIERSVVTEQNIFVESSTEILINVILAFQNEKWKIVDEYLECWTDEQLEKEEDINKKDKILLIKARRERIIGDNAVAQKYYNLIKTPFFKQRILHNNNNN